MKKIVLILIVLLIIMTTACSNPGTKDSSSESIIETTVNIEVTTNGTEQTNIESTGYSDLSEEYENGNILYELGLFNGVSTTQYEPNLEGDMNREEAMKMIVSALGWEPSLESECPFSDVSNWAKPYVGRAYLKGIALGTVPEKNIFGAKDSVTMQQLLTFYLRALGYETSYAYENAMALGEITGLTDDIEVSDDFLKRYHLVMVTYNSLGSSKVNSARTLAEDLISEGRIDMDTALKYGLIKTYLFQSQRENGPVYLTKDNFDAEILNEDKALVFFYQKGNPLCEDIMQSYYNAAIALADTAKVAIIDESVAGEILTKHNITSFPTIKLYKKGVGITLPSVPDKDALVQWVKNN